MAGLRITSGCVVKSASGGCNAKRALIAATTPYHAAPKETQPGWELPRLGSLGLFLWRDLRDLHNATKTRAVNVATLDDIWRDC